MVILSAVLMIICVSYEAECMCRAEAIAHARWRPHEVSCSCHIRSFSLSLSLSLMNTHSMAFSLIVFMVSLKMSIWHLLFANRDGLFFGIGFVCSHLFVCEVILNVECV